MIRTLVSILLSILVAFTAQTGAGAIEYPSAGVSRRVLHVLNPGHWAPMAETYGFIFKHREVSDQYWLVTFKEVRTAGKDSRYLVLLLDGQCTRNMQEFHSIPKQCVQEEKWMSVLGIELLIKHGLLESEYKDLYPQIQKYIKGDKSALQN